MAPYLLSICVWISSSDTHIHVHTRSQRALSFPELILPACRPRNDIQITFSSRSSELREGEDGEQEDDHPVDMRQVRGAHACTHTHTLPV